MFLEVSEIQTNGVVLSRQSFSLSEGEFAIGRASICDCVIGRNIGDVARSLSRVQATIVVGGDNKIFLYDGTIRDRSLNGCFFQGEPLSSPLEIPKVGAIVELLRNSEYSIVAEFSETSRRSPQPREDCETYTGEELQHLLEIKEQIAGLSGQIKHLEQSQREDQQRFKRLKQLILGALIVPAALGALTLTDPKARESAISDLKNTLVSLATPILLAVAIAAIKPQQSEEK
jgi:FHA domain